MKDYRVIKYLRNSLGLLVLCILNVLLTACHKEDDPGPSPNPPTPINNPSSVPTGGETPGSNSNDKHFVKINNVSFKMIDVEGGTFSMGATSEQGGDAKNNEKPVHSVTLSDYLIGETEVTQELWETVMGFYPTKYKGAKKPVTEVTWNDCQKFIKSLNTITGRHFRLPTEAEWEYAARGGKKSKGYKYSGSNNIDEVAWYNDNSWALGENSTYYGPQNVGGKLPNELGIYDMSGNGNEWCSDLYDTYSSSPQTNPQGATTGTSRVIRGGSWNGLGAQYCRVSYRLYSHYDNSASGFRLAE